MYLLKYLSNSKSYLPWFYQNFIYLNITIIITMFLKLQLSLYLFYNIVNIIVLAHNKNVMLIMIDDLRPLLDEKHYHIMPNVNKMARRGVNFINAYAQQALCAPSRNSLLTGRRPDSLRLYDFYSYWRHSIANFTTLPQYFKENGYDTFSVGKIFHPGKSSNYTDDYPYSWSQLPYHPPSEIYKNAKVCKDSTNFLHRNLICPVEVDKQPGGTLPDLESLKYAGKILRKGNNSRKPFFLAVGFHKPHIPLKYPIEYLARIPISKVEPPNYPHMTKSLPTVSWHPWTDVRSRDDIKRLNISFPFGTMPKKWTLKIKQSYYAAAMYVDNLVGELMSHVDLRKTVVVLTSDHGWSLAENGLWAKYSNFDVALRVPLIFLAPSLPSKTLYKPVELIDIFPTLVSLAGLPDNIPKCKGSRDKSTLCFEGKNLLSTTEMECSTLFSISQYPRPSVKPQKNSDKPRLKDIKIMGYSIRTKRYRYTTWISFNNTSYNINWNKTYGVELYDHILDPDESNNLYLIHKYKNITNKLHTLLKSQIHLNQDTNINM